MIGFRQWFVAVLSALLLHTVIILPFLLDTPEPVDHPLDGGLEIGLSTGLDVGDGTSEFAAEGDGSASSENSVQVQVAKNPTVKTVVKAPLPQPQSQIKPQSQTVEPETIVTHEIPASADVIVVEQAKAEVVESKIPDIPVDTQETSAVANTVSTAPALPQPQGMAGSGNTGAKVGGKPGSADGNGKPGGNGMAKGRGTGNGRLLRSYFGDIAALIDAHKDYPGEVKKEKQEGTVIVAFSINRKGELLSSVIKKSSGYALLDKAALATLERSSPFPPIPKAIGRDTLKIAVPIDYTLITN